jgi:hypothetical protein
LLSAALIPTVPSDVMYTRALAIAEPVPLNMITLLPSEAFPINKSSPVEYK